MDEEATEQEATEEEAMEEKAVEEGPIDDDAYINEHYGITMGCDQDYWIDSAKDIGVIEFLNLGVDEIERFYFGDVAIAFKFYNMYAKSRGFVARKSKTRKNHKKELVEQNFVCNREGYRLEKFYKLENRKKEPRVETRCGCTARIQVRFHSSSGRWLVTFFSNKHNHQCMEPRFYGMLSGHRKMKKFDISQMNGMRRGGISTSQIYGSLATQSCDYQHVGFKPRDMYNQLARQRRQIPYDAQSALEFLQKMATKDPCMYFSHEVDAEGVLQQLFWFDGISRTDYQLFGDVLAFDATYKKNKYRCPVVVFSGVNHQNQSVVFAVGLVSDEKEDTYVWLLEQLLEAMKGKHPISVTIDGDLAMRNAIQKVFPNAQHRLCAWHLIRNATSNIGKPRFTSMFKKCMLGDYKISMFHRKWFEMVEEFGVQDKPWITDMYEKRHMWATAHIRGKFFVGFRTTSHCEVWI